MSPEGDIIREFQHREIVHLDKACPQKHFIFFVVLGAAGSKVACSPDYSLAIVKKADRLRSRKSKRLAERWQILLKKR